MFNPAKFLEEKLLKAGLYVVTPVDYKIMTKSDGSVGFVISFMVEGHETAEVVSFWHPDNEVAVRQAMALAKLLDPSMVQKDYKTPLDFFEAVLAAATGKRIVANISVVPRSDGTLANRVKAFVRLEEGKAQNSMKKRDDEVPF